MPAGMELFPAANEEQWSWIKKVIDESDYYIVLMGGRYGSLSEVTGFSYTEMEYRYAVEIGLPIIAFLHEDISKIEAGKTESVASSKKKLEQFRALAQKKLCKYWSNPTDLGARVSRSITQLIKHSPAPGWIRANRLDEIESVELNRLRQKISELEAQLATKKVTPIDTVELAQGDDVFDIEYSYVTKQAKENSAGREYFVKGVEADGIVSVSWNKLFGFLSPDLIESREEHEVIKRLNEFITARGAADIKNNYPGHKIERVRIYSSSFDLIKVQFRALGLVDIDNDQWWLTATGDAQMARLLAKKKA